MRLSAEQRAAYEAEAKRCGLSLSEWLRRSADESVALANALELEVESVRQRHREPEQAPERPPRRPAPKQPEQRMGDRRPRGITVGEALRQADRNAGRSGPLL